MSKRNQINITLDETEMNNVNEYCRVHGMTPQGFFKVGAQRLIDGDILEQKADLMTMQAMREMKAGLSAPIDDLLEMIEEDKKIGEKMVRSGHLPAKKKR
ncbi:hypothetical protein [Geoalkalibacter subterraneus]|uniref:CopG family transcriptional regulator n=1 Tax=Geoalkalibacter subterraneus TaxID=483547 RepID=A0A0B5FIC0_9BACT|nr:hypothetical protein [Geoalkalibacter subterraneus]AJF07078.1 hypothetical protein GSUB_11615 [Geoalkalibacter subterraneus]